MIQDIQQDAKQRMQKSLDALQQDLAKLRTGRAHPSLLDHLTVNYYGNETPLNQVAGVSVSDPRTLSVSPWEKNMVEAVEKAIRSADLGLNPATSGQVIRVPLPPLTEERRKDMMRVIKQEAESARVAVRNIRRDANGDFKDLLKEKEITEDELRRAEATIQKITDEFIAKIEEMLGAKEKEIMSV